jgi:hypothetical protein
MVQRGGVVHDLVERKQAEVHRHHFDNGPHPGDRGADAGADERGFGQRRIANALRRIPSRPLLTA